MNVKTATPNEIDSRLADVYYATIRIAAPINRYRQAVKEAHKMRGYPGDARRAAALPGLERRSIVAEMIIKAIERRESAPLESEFARRGGWSRFYVVGGGHIHSSRRCGSLRRTTLLGWLPECSGDDEAQTIAKHGVTACTHCFPDAPVVTAADPNVCTGSGEYAAPETRTRNGLYATCPSCGVKVAVVGSVRLRKHKA